MQLDDYQNAALATAIYPGQGTALGLSYVALKMNGEAGEFAEHLGKAFRDDAYGQTTTVGTGDLDMDMSIELTSERRTKLIKEIGDVLWYLAAGAKELGTTLGEAAAINIAKLSGRAAAGTLQGSGDDR